MAISTGGSGVCSSVITTFLGLSSPGGSDGRESACNAGDLGSIPGSGRSSGEGNGNPLQCSYLENLMDWRTRFSIKLKNRYEHLGTRKGVSKQDVNLEVINIGMAL